jgi:hypothetical protein
MFLVMGCSGSAPPRGGQTGPAGASDQTDGVTLGFVKAQIGPMVWEEAPRKTLPKYLQVWVKTTTTRRIAYRSWSMPEPPTDTYVLDDLGKKYPVVRDAGYAGTSEYVGSSGSLGLKASESVAALLLFEPPQSKATTLTIHLGGANVEVNGDFTLAIKNWK